jgi:hypothetical protein
VIVFRLIPFLRGHLIAASSLYSERFFWMDMKADARPRPEFERAEVARGPPKTYCSDQSKASGKVMV